MNKNKESKHKSNSQTSPRKILLIDDESEIRSRLFEHLVGSYGDALQVFEAGSGESAIQVLRNFEIDFVISDFCMPDGNGLSVYVHLAKSEQNLKLIFFTSTTDLESLLPAMANFYHGTIRKPDFDGVVRIVGEWLQENRKELSSLLGSKNEKDAVEN